MELVNNNWDVDNWITGNAKDGFVYDGCAAFQKVLDGKSISEQILVLIFIYQIYSV